MNVHSEDENKKSSFPDVKALEEELSRVSYGIGYKQIIKNAIIVLIVTAAVVVLINTLLLPVLKIDGNSMSPTLRDSDIVVSLKTSKLNREDICFFYDNNRILCKRVIAVSGDVISIDGDGNVMLNNELLSEPNITEKSLGECDIEFPYTIPDDSYFVMGDNRPTSIDSRSTEIGCIPKDRVVGKILFCFWPVSDFGIVN